MKNKLEMAKDLRQEVAELDELAFELIWNGVEKDNKENKQKADQLWQQHVELLKQVYPKPNPRDHIQAQILDTYRDDAIVLETSFTNMDSYNKAQDQQGLDYYLVSNQVNQCEYCDEYYLVKYETKKGKQTFCSQEHLEEDEFERERWANDDEYNYDQWYDYNFPDGDRNDRDVPQW